MIREAHGGGAVARFGREIKLHQLVWEEVRGQRVELFLQSMVRVCLGTHLCHTQSMFTAKVIATDTDTSLLGAKWIGEFCIVRLKRGSMKQECAAFWTELTRQRLH